MKTFEEYIAEIANEHSSREIATAIAVPTALFGAVAAPLAYHSFQDAVLKKSFVGSVWVLDKNHQPAYTTNIMVGKTLVPQYHPESFSVTIRGLNKAGEMKDATFTVSKDE